MGVAEALFRVFVGTCPREFRRNYGAPAVETFVETTRRRRTDRGFSGAAAFVACAYADILWTSLREHAAMLGKDLSFALRLIAKSWVSSAIVVATLAIAIGIGAAVFSAIDTVLVAPLPYPDASRLVFIFDRTTGSPDGHGTETSLPNTQDWIRLGRSFESLGSFAGWTPTRTGQDVPAALAGNVVTTGFFEALGAKPQLGRLFDDADARPGAARTVVISQAYWRQAFGASPQIIGKTIELNDFAYRIVGVLPEDFVVPRVASFGSQGSSVFRVLPKDAASRNAHYLNTVARLRPGVTVAQAQADMDRVAALLRARFPIDDGRLEQHVVALTDELFGTARLMLTIAFAAVVGILAIACLNVANILLGRIAERERELAIRLAVGASRRRLIAQLLAESALFAFFGGALGLALCAVLVRVLPALGLHIPRLSGVHVSPAVLLFTIAASAICAVAIGILPALTLSSTHIAGVLKDAGRGGSNARGKLLRAATVTLELALALTLVMGSGVLLRSFVALAAIDVGFAYDGVVATNTVFLPAHRYATPASQLAFARTLVGRLAAIPGLRDPGLMVSTPLSNMNYNAEEFSIVGRARAPGPLPDVEYNAVTRGALDCLRLRLLRGRLIDDRDNERSQRVAIVTKAFARQNFHGEDPIGRRVIIAYGVNPPWGRTIVGIVDDFKMEELTEAPLPQIIVPFSQDVRSDFQIVARSNVPGPVLAAQITAAIRTIDSKMPPRTIDSYADYVAGQRSTASTAAMLLGFMALVALLLATIGTYGVVAYNVGQRTREFGIRRALGARAGAIVGTVLHQALLLAGAGVVLGALLSFAGSRTISHLLYEISPLDPLTFVTVAAVLLAVASGAALAPALRATRADPVAILRHE